MKKFTLLFFMLYTISVSAEHRYKGIKGVVKDNSGEPISGATVIFNSTTSGTVTNANGEYFINHVPQNADSLTVSFLGYTPQSKRINSHYITFTLSADALVGDVVEVFGSRYKQPEKMDFLTRMPLRPSEQLQSISVVSEKMIEQQGNLTLSDATKNVVGVSTFAVYGGAGESLSARGFRGIPVLKNGVRVHSDFRGTGTLNEMQGVESIQVIKGSAAVTQGIGNDTGSAGGTVNIATKTPKFINEAEVSLRAGSWGLVRGTFDLQQVFSKKENFAVRFNGAVERSDSYRKYVSKDRFYLNPSISWRLSSKTTVIAEMDYLHDSRTPDRGTVNLAADSVNALYDMPHDKFLGFKSDRIFTNQMTYSIRVNHQFSDKLSLRVAAVGASLNIDNTGTSTSKLYKNKEYNMLKRSLGRSLRNDQNQSVQIDLVGSDIYTGKVKHTFQAGIDYKRSAVSTTSYNSVVVDTINVLNIFSNTLPGDIELTADAPENSTEYSYGVLGQYVVSYNDYIKGVVGARYSFGNSTDNTSAGAVTGNAFNPMFGIIVSPIKGLNLFGSYTNTTNLRSAANLKTDGTPIGASSTEQFEVGVKSEWLKNRLRFNLTLFSVMNSDLAYAVYDDAGQTTGRYEEAGDLKRRGVEVEVAGRPFNNLQVILGYAFLDAQYQNSPAYMDGSTPMNAPKHTANGWVYYSFDKSVFKGVSLGLGAYYLGKRPVNDFTKKTTHANTTPGVKPFDMNAFTTLNATVGYAYRKSSINVVFNNILNSVGYSSYYRGGFINPTDPFNVSVTLKHRF